MTTNLNYCQWSIILSWKKKKYYAVGFQGCLISLKISGRLHWKEQTLFCCVVVDEENTFLETFGGFQPVCGLFDLKFGYPMSWSFGCDLQVCFYQLDSDVWILGDNIILTNALLFLPLVKRKVLYYRYSESNWSRFGKEIIYIGAFKWMYSWSSKC